MPDHLYVIGEEGSGLAKVGRARDVSRRLREIQTGYPRDLAILHIEHGAGDLESRVHRLLADRRRRGEWFDFGRENPGGVVRKAVQDVQAGIGPPEPRPSGGAPVDPEHIRQIIMCMAEGLGYDPEAAFAVFSRDMRESQKTPQPSDP